jgi:hypothetical protein
VSDDPGSPAPARGRKLQGRRVLVVEDEALIGMMIEDALVDEGCEVTLARQPSMRWWSTSYCLTSPGTNSSTASVLFIQHCQC